MIVDASIACKWYLNEEGSEKAFTVFLLDEPLIAPELIIAEVGHVLLKRRRGGLIAPQFALSVIADLPQRLDQLVPITSLARNAMDLSLRHNHSFYDCLYLALALERGERLITADAAFARKVSNSTGVIVLLPNDL